MVKIYESSTKVNFKVNYASFEVLKNENGFNQFLSYFWTIMSAICWPHFVLIYGNSAYGWQVFESIFFAKFTNCSFGDDGTENIARFLNFFYNFTSFYNSFLDHESWGSFNKYVNHNRLTRPVGYNSFWWFLTVTFPQERGFGKSNLKMCPTKYQESHHFYQNFFRNY